ncbi:MAG: hypothetical protein K2N44_07915 [Lachnospiraceae bacterium]|nr:hypothetical protein [Lachnospiraceae bacterium]
MDLGKRDVSRLRQASTTRRITAREWAYPATKIYLFLLLICQRSLSMILWVDMTMVWGQVFCMWQTIIFHPWEGGEGKITAQYTMSLLGMARKALSEGCYVEAEKLLKDALVYPENLGEGKLEGKKDNHLYYHLGLALEGQGRNEEAKDCFETATIGTDEPAGAMYYNDQPADMILYQGLAYLKPGKVREAKSRFYRLIDYGEQHLEDQMRVEYFAVSLPDSLIFDEDYTSKNRAHCYYLMALGNMGLGDDNKAAGFLKEAISYDVPGI